MVVIKDETGMKKTTLFDVGVGATMLGNVGLIGTLVAVGTDYVSDFETIRNLIRFSMLSGGIGVEMVGISFKDYDKTDKNVKLVSDGLIVMGVPFVFLPILDVIFPNLRDTYRTMAGFSIIVPLGLVMMLTGYSRFIHDN